MHIDVEAILQPISDDGPCGPDPSYTPVFAILESLVQGKGETQFSEAEEPNWNEVRKGAISVLEKSKELTTSLYLTLALLKQEGFPGFKDGLLLTCELLDRFWDTVHPQLDPDDNNDPLERINIIANLAAPPGTFGDPFKFIQRIRELPLCNSRQLGRFSLREIMIVKGEITPADKSQSPTSDMSIIEAAFRDSDSEEMEAKFKAVEESIEVVKKIESIVNERGEGDYKLDLGILEDILTRILTYSKFNNTEGESAIPTEVEHNTPQTMENSQPSKSLSSEINSLHDVNKAFDKIIRFYEKNEPSSPIPLMVKRTKKLVGKNFREIVSDIASNAQSQIDELFGPSDEENGA